MQTQDASILSSPLGEKSDGRSKRAEKTREALLEAAYYFMFLNQGRMPTMVEAARRAGVSIRSGFSHFHDINNLLMEAIKVDAKALDVGILIAQRAGMSLPDDLGKDAPVWIDAWWEDQLIRLARAMTAQAS